ISTIDFGTFHSYPEVWQFNSNATAWGTQWINDHATSQKSIGKPVIIEEFGVKTNRVNTYTTWYSTVVNSGLSGDLIWQAGISAQRGWDDGYAVFPNTPEYTLQKDHATALKARA
ncbi:hypothetical protein FRC12_016438, partial [Ceratobasidium sp. 428]